MANENQPTLYERLGGVYGIATVVDDFIDRIMDDARLNANPAVDEAHHKACRRQPRHQLLSINFFRSRVRILTELTVLAGRKREAMAISILGMVFRSRKRGIGILPPKIVYWTAVFLSPSPRLVPPPNSEI